MLFPGNYQGASRFALPFMTAQIQFISQNHQSDVKSRRQRPQDSVTMQRAILLASLVLTYGVGAQKANTFQYVGLSGVSAQQMFLGTMNKVYIIDKTGGCSVTPKGLRADP